jgi:hypothetical protein
LLAFLGTALVVGSTARADIDYDFSTGAGVNRFGYKSTIPSSAAPPAVNTIPNTSFTSSDYANVGATDDLRQLSNASGSANYAATRFVFAINESPASITAVSVSWEGLTSSRGNVSVYLWNANTASYTLVGSTATRSSPDATIVNSFTVNPEHYIDASSRITVLALNAQNSKDVLTDYIRVSLRQCESNVDCDDNNECTNDACSSGACTHSNNSASCSDDNVCTVGDICSAGSCQGGSGPDCSNAGDPCHTASCDPAGADGNCSILTVKADGESCDDGSFCTVNDVCQSGSCGGDVRDCSASGDQCNMGICNETLDQCTAQPIADGTDCDDLDACNVGESCQGGTCTGGQGPDCSSQNGACNTASCDPEASEGNCDRITSVADGSSCDDGEFCTADDTCLSGLCVGGDTPCESGASAMKVETPALNA